MLYHGRLILLVLSKKGWVSVESTLWLLELTVVRGLGAPEIVEGMVIELLLILTKARKQRLHRESPTDPVISTHDPIISAVLINK